MTCWLDKHIVREPILLILLYTPSIFSNVTKTVISHSEDVNYTVGFAREKQRSDQLNGHYKLLRTLNPNPTKPDRASVIKGTIEYIKELVSTLNSLKLAVKNTTTWVTRKSEDTDVDVQITHDGQVTIRLVCRNNNINCFLCVSKLLDQLHLQATYSGFPPQYICIFCCKPKIYEGCSIDASVIANKVIEALDDAGALSHNIS